MQLLHAYESLLYTATLRRITVERKDYADMKVYKIVEIQPPLPWHFQHLGMHPLPSDVQTVQVLQSTSTWQSSLRLWHTVNSTMIRAVYQKANFFSAGVETPSINFVNSYCNRIFITWRILGHKTVSKHGIWKKVIKIIFKNWKTMKIK